MNAGLLVAGLLVGGCCVGAQAPHPCDLSTSTAYRQAASALTSLRIGFCFRAIDGEGHPIPDIGFALRVNGGPLIDLGFLAPVTLANAAGLSYYEFAHPALVAGTITLTAYLRAIGMSAPSEPITLSLVGVPPAPQQVVVTR